MPRRLFSTTQGMQSNNYYEDDPHTHELPNHYFEEGPWQGNLKGAPKSVPVPVRTVKYTAQNYQIRDLKEKDPLKTEVDPTIGNHPRDTDYAPSNPRSYDKEWVHIPPWRGPPKREDEDGYPLPLFDEGLGLENKRMHDDVRMKMEPNWSDSDQGNDSDIEAHPVHPLRRPQKNMSALLDSSQQVSEVLSHLVEHQNNLQHKNLEIMERLVSRSTNSFVLDDIPVFDGLKGSVDFENWLLELDKAAEITGMGMLELAFSKSSGTLHKMIKCLRREKSWEYIKEKLQITYSKLATDVHASTDLNQNKQKCQESLEDFIERFYQNYKRVTGEDPARTRNPHIINTFVQNLYNRDIRKRVSGTPMVDLQSAFNSAIKIQRKLKHFEGYEYVSDEDDDDKRINVLDLNKDGMDKKVIPGMTGAAGIGPCFRCGGYGHFSKDCPMRTQTQDRPDTPQYGKLNNNQYIPLQMLGTNPPTLTQQITTHGIITLEAWAKIQEKVNTLAENNELIDK